MPVVEISARPTSFPLLGPVKRTLDDSGRPTSIPVTYFGSQVGAQTEGRQPSVSRHFDLEMYAAAVTQYAILARQPSGYRSRTTSDQVLEGFAARENDLFPRSEDRCDARWRYFGRAIIDYLKVIPVEIRPLLVAQTRDRCLVDMLHLVNYSTSPERYESGLRVIIGGASLSSLLSATYTLDGYAQHPRAREKMNLFGSLGHTPGIQPNPGVANNSYDPRYEGNPTLLRQVGEVVKDLSYEALVAIRTASEAIAPRSKHSAQKHAAYQSSHPHIQIPDVQIPYWRFTANFEASNLTSPVSALVYNVRSCSKHFTELVLMLDIFHRMLSTAPLRFACFSGLRSYPLGIAPQVQLDLLKVIDRCAINEGIQAYNSCRRTRKEQGFIGTPLLSRRGLEFQFRLGVVEVTQAPLQMFVKHPTHVIPFSLKAAPRSRVPLQDVELVWALAVVGHAAADVISTEIKSRDAQRLASKLKVS